MQTPPQTLHARTPDTIAIPHPGAGNIVRPSRVGVSGPLKGLKKGPLKWGYGLYGKI